MHVIVDDLLINYQTRVGKNSLNILFLHGWGDSSKGQHKFLDSLSALGNVIAPDLPGFGDSQAMSRDFSLLDYAKFVSSFCSKINLKHIDLIIGHSNGASIAIKAIANHELQAKKLILIGAAGIRGTNKSKNSLLKVVTKTGKVISSPLPIGIKSRLRSKLYSSVGSDMLLSENLQETFKNIVSEDLRGDARKINIPSLLIYGEQDRSTPPKFGMIYHEAIQGSSLEIIGSAGHFVQFDQPEITLNLIKDFSK